LAGRTRRKRRHRVDLPHLRERISKILPLLEASHEPITPREKRGRCIDIVVACMLTQNTNMANARSGYRQLRRAFTSWNQVMEAPVEAVQRCIAICGLARMRARRLQSMLRVIKAREGKLDLQFLGERTPADAYAYLTSFFGIGPKTAACTLLFAFGMPLFPVDKGIYRMCRRLKLVRAKAGEAECEGTMEAALTPTPARVYPLHVLMFRHAKAFCRPRNPKCRTCRLVEVCPSGRLRVRHRRARCIDAPPGPARPIRLSARASGGLIKHGDGDLDLRPA
jgi:endonuclease-3